MKKIFKVTVFPFLLFAGSLNSAVSHDELVTMYSGWLSKITQSFYEKDLKFDPKSETTQDVELKKELWFEGNQVLRALHKRAFTVFPPKDQCQAIDEASEKVRKDFVLAGKDAKDKALRKKSLEYAKSFSISECNDMARQFNVSGLKTLMVGSAVASGFGLVGFLTNFFINKEKTEEEIENNFKERQLKKRLLKFGGALAAVGGIASLFLVRQKWIGKVDAMKSSNYDKKDKAKVTVFELSDQQADPYKPCTPTFLSLG